MNIVLYKNVSDSKVVSKDITLINTLTGTLREQCSIVNPIIKIEGLTSEQAKVCNYAYIEDFGRYYYINDITYDGNLFVLTLHCDVLMSFKTDFKKLDGVISRQENNYNLYLQDGLFKTYQNNIVGVKQFPNGFNTFQYILTVAGS